MKTLIAALLAALLLSSCEGKGNVNRGYVISKSPLETEIVDPVLEQEEDLNSDSP